MPTKQLLLFPLLLALLLTSTPIASVRATPSAETVYVVQPGDSLTRIARRFDVTVAALMAANDLADANLIFVGQQLVIPAAVVEADPEPAPTNPGPAPAIESVPPNSAGYNNYTVRPGDSLYRIAQQFGLSVAELREANSIEGDTIFIGQVLSIPGVASAPTTEINFHGQVFGPDDYVASIHAVLDWLVANDPQAFTRVERYVTSIQPSASGHLAWSRLRGFACYVELPVASLLLMASILYHEASHCQQWLTSGVVGEAEGEVYAYGQQIDFMRRHSFDPALIAFYEQILGSYASQ